MSSLGIFNKETKTYQKVAGTSEAAVLDTAMSDTSENPVQNKVIKKYVDDKQVEVPIAETGKAGIVKPADGLTVEEDGTLKVRLDDTTLTMDQVNNVIKLADTLKEKINGALPAANVVNNLTTTEAGFALDARQANPNMDGTLAKQLSDLNGSLKIDYILNATTDYNGVFSTNITSEEFIVLYAWCNLENGIVIPYYNHGINLCFCVVDANGFVPYKNTENITIAYMSKKF